MTAKNERERFWMVWGEGTSAPTHKHECKQYALSEAERLAKMNPERTFYVLKVTAAVVANEPAIRRLNLVRPDIIPF